MKDKLNIDRLKSIVWKFNEAKILVVGDLMLDEFIWGDVERISPEAPVPVVWAKKRTYAPGGASNVASNISSLGAKATVAGVIGSDSNGRILKSEFKRKRIDTGGIFVQSGRHTTLKTRIIAGHQQVVRLDWEDRHPIEKTQEFKIIKFINDNIDKYSAIIIEDYGKGVIASGLMKEIRPTVKKYKKIVAVDPKEEHFDYYEGLTVITPNRKEAENAIRYLKIKGKKDLNIDNDKLTDDRQIDLAGEELVRCLNLEALLITLGEQGMRLFEKGKTPYHIPTVAQEVFDVAGAGDTVIAALTLALSQGANMTEAAYIANFAAGIVVGKLGVAVTDQEEMISCLNKVKMNKAVPAPLKLK